MADKPNEDDNLLDAWRRRLGEDEDHAPVSDTAGNQHASDTQDHASDPQDTAEWAGDSKIQDAPRGDALEDDPEATATWNPDETAVWNDEVLAADETTVSKDNGGVPGDEQPADDASSDEAPTDDVSNETVAFDGVAQAGEGGPQTDETQAFGAQDASITLADATEVQPALQSAPPAYIPESDRYHEEVSEGEPAKTKRRWPWVIVALIVLLLGGYVGAAYALQDRIPSGLTVSGVPVGGLDKADAYEAVETGLAPQMQNPRTVTVPEVDVSEQVSPGAIDLAVDLEKTFDGLTGFSLHPMKMWAQITGGANVDAVLSYDDAGLTSEVDRLAEAFAQEPSDATLTIADANVTIQPAEDGLNIVKEDSKATIIDEWLAGDAPIQLGTEAVDPAISTEELETFVAETIEPLLSDPISITIKDVMVELQPEQTGSLLSFTNEGGKLELSVDQEGLEGVVEERAGEVLGTAKDATIKIVDGAPVLTPSEDGESIDIEQISTALLDIAGGTDRTVVAEITTQEPEFTTEEAEKMGIKEVVSSISTPLTADSVRTTNLVVGSKKVSNILIKPGERFNLGETLGPVDAEHGFVSSGVVTNGFNSTAMGGGLSQLSTNTFNVGYRAGMIDVYHQPHSKYFSRYPAGLEATIWGDQVPMIWENNTPYGAMIESWVADGQVHTRLWSTKYWDVDVWQGERFAFRQPESRVNRAADCEPQGAGASGFSITVGRTVSLNGEVHDTDQYTWTYEPVHAVTCG